MISNGAFGFLSMLANEKEENSSVKERRILSSLSFGLNLMEKKINFYLDEMILGISPNLAPHLPQLLHASQSLEVIWFITKFEVNLLFK